MKKLLVVLGLLLLVPCLAFAQASYFVDYYSNNPGPVPTGFDQVVRIVNVGLGGTPLTSPVGDICVNIYVFDNNQEMIACCSERITPNELDSASVGNQLTSNPVTSVVPAAGVIKIGTTAAGAGACDPRTVDLTTASTSFAVVFGTHLQVTGGATFLTETEKLSSPLSTAEAGFLTTACSFARYLGSGKGICTSTFPGH
jgi:hypothetical protein